MEIIYVLGTNKLQINTIGNHAGIVEMECIVYSYKLMDFSLHYDNKF